jgi:hypothetical protein
VKNWFAAQVNQHLKQPLKLLGLSPLDFFLIRKVKEGLAGRSLNDDIIYNILEGVTVTITIMTFATAFTS